MVEVLVVCTIISILITSSALALADWQKKEKLKVAQLGVYYLLKQTRVQAISRAMNWSTQNTLTSHPYNFSQADATLNGYIERITKTGTMAIVVTPDIVSFDVRGGEASSTEQTIIISADGCESRRVIVQSSGVIKLI